MVPYLTIVIVVPAEYQQKLPNAVVDSEAPGQGFLVIQCNFRIRRSTIKKFSRPPLASCRFINLHPDGAGRWHGFLPGVGDRDEFKYRVVGDPGRGLKRDPHARELSEPDWNCIVRRSDFPWRSPVFAPLRLPANSLLVFSR